MCALYCSPCIFTMQLQFFAAVKLQKLLSRHVRKHYFRLSSTCTSDATYNSELSLSFCSVNVQNKNLINGNFHNLHFLLAAAC